MRSVLMSVMSVTRQHLKEIKFAPVEKFIRFFFSFKNQTDLIRAYHAWKRSLQPKLNQQLSDILAAHPQPRTVIVFAPGLDWQRQLFQRPQQLALALAKRGALVFYAQSTPLQGNAALQSVHDRLYVCALPLEHFSIMHNFFVYVLTWNRKYLLKFTRPRILYDYVDDLAAFAGDAAQLSRSHQALLGEAEVVTATAGQLFQQIRQARPDALLVPNGVDFDHFQAEQGFLSTPPVMARLCAQGKPVVGYYGALANWFDYTLMIDLARKRADLNFVLIGTRHDSSLDTSGLLQQKNVTYLGPKAYADLPAYLSGFDVAILPFQVNPITQSTSPLKLFEYCAGGKPVVSTPLREVIQYPEILIGSDSTEFSARIDQALAMRTDAHFIQKLKQIGLENTWETHAERILQAIEGNPVKASQVKYKCHLPK